MRWTISVLFLAACTSNPDGGGGNTTLTITTYQASGPTNTELVAAQDGDGPWAVVNGTAGLYTTTLHSDRYGVMTSCTNGTSAGANLWYGAVSDATALYLDDCADPGPAGAGVQGSVTGAAAGDPARVLDGFFSSADIPAGMTAYTLDTFAGPQTLIAEELANDRPVKLVTAPGTVTDGETVNFDLASGFAPETHAVTGTGLSAVTVSYRDANGISVFDRPASPASDFRAIPAAQLGSGLNRLAVSDANGSSVIRYFKTPADQHIVFPAPFTLAQQPTASATPYPNVHFVVVPEAGTIYDLTFSTTNQQTMTSRTFSIEMTPAWIAKQYPDGAAIDYTAPDFHSLAGWMTAWQPEAGVPLDWSVLPTKNTNVDWFASVPPGTMFDHDGSELDFTGVNGELPAP